MAGGLQIAGAAVSNKAPRYAPLYTSRYFSGLVTQRSPLRSAGSSYEERYLGTRGDALIDGSNCEITPKLTLARRPGNAVYNSNSFTAVDAFFAFRMFGPNTESIEVLADTATGVYIVSDNADTLLFSKSAGAGQTFFQSIGNTLYFSDGVDQNKYVGSLFTRTTSTNPLPNIGDSVTLSAAQTPFNSTYLIDSNGNLQELYATVVGSITNVTYVESTNTLTLAFSGGFTMTAGVNYIIWNAATALWLNGITFTAVTGTTANLLNELPANYSSTPDTGNITLAEGGSPVTGASVPVWNTTVPSAANDFLGGSTIDGTALWMNRGNPIENWGIVAGTTAPTVTVGTATAAWKTNTFYSLAGVVIDTQYSAQFNIWQVTVAGKSGGSNPFTSNPTSGSTTVTDGGVTWKCVASTHSGDAAWSASTTYASGHLIVESASGTNCLFQLQPDAYPTYSGNVTAKFYPHASHFSGQCELRNPTDETGNNPGVAPYTLQATGTNNSVLFNPNQQGNSGQTSPLQWATLSAAGDITGYTTPYAGATPGNYTMVVYGTMVIPTAGSYSFTIFHDDGMFWGIGPSGSNQPTRISGPTNCPAPTATLTALQGYPVLGANNTNGVYQDLFVINFPAAGSYPFELDFAKSGNSGQFLCLYCNGQTPVPGTPETGLTQPVWPAFSTSFAPNYATVQETNGSAMGGLSGETWPPATTGPGPLQWANLGPITDAVWTAAVNYTLPDTTITDPNNYTEGPFRAGISGTTIPTFSQSLNALTLDNPNLIWINQGPASAPAPGTISAFNGGYEYTIALVNTATNTVSNGSPLSVATGNFIGAAGIHISGGLPPTASIDPQADYVAIFRTTDGETTPFLIPGTGNPIYTIPLVTYLLNGYNDTDNDTQLNNLIEAPIAGENTPPPLGIVNETQELTYLNRVWVSSGNTVYYSSGPDTPVGNGFEGFGPDNFQELPSLVKRLVPTIVGLFIFTVSDIYLIPNQGATIPSAVLYAPGLGLLSYNALDVFGTSIGFFASDSTFDVLDVSGGPQEVGFCIGNLLQVSPWNPSTAYVSWHTSGEDKAWFLSDGTTGWYRLCVTPNPEQGITVSPFATIVGGAEAVQSIETSPGVHQLLIGSPTTGPILARNLTTFQDNTSNYTWFATVGSHVLANSGQLAEVPFLTVKAAKVGSQPSLSVILDEAVPGYTGPFENIPNPVYDPPNFKPSDSIYSLRYYLVETQDPAICQTMQYKISYGPSDVKEEIWATVIWGALLQES